MTILRALLLAAVLAGPLCLAVALRRRWLAVGGASGVLASLVLLVGALTIGAELLGAVGAFGPWGLVGLSALTGATALALRTRRPGAVTRSDAPGAEPSGDRWVAGVALAAAAGVVAQWGARTMGSLRHGITDFDSLRYHLPNAVRLAQDGSLLHPLFVLPDPTEGYHPMGSEVLHAFPMALLHSDALSPIINLGWLALALLAGWCLGARQRLAPLTLLVTATVLATPIMAGAGAGTAKSDIASVALVLAAAGLLVEAGHRAGEARAEAPRLLAVAGLAAGMAVGAKYTVVIPVGALSVAAVAWGGPGRWRRAAIWVGAAAVGGGFWILRNLVASGNPLPSADLPGLSAPDRPINETYDFSILHYATRARLWDDVFLPAWRQGLGRALPLLALLLAAGLVAALVRTSLPARVLAAAGAVGLAGYLALPLTAGGAEGHPVLGLVAVNARYGAAPLLLGLCGAAMALGGRSERARVATVAAVVLALLLTWTTSGPLPAWTGSRVAAVLVGAAALAAVAGVPHLRRLLPAHPRWAVVLAVGAVVAGAVGTQVLVDRYPRGRNVQRSEDAELVAATEGRPGTRFGVVGLDVGYLLVDHELRSSVRYLGIDAPHGGFRDAASCRELLDAARRFHAEVIVVAPARTDPSHTWPPARDWLDGLVGIDPLAASADQALFAVTDLGAAERGCEERPAP